MKPVAKFGTKPLGHKAYGSIAHLPDSRMSRGDKGLNEGQVRILLAQPRKGDVIYVTEKMDGANTAVVKLDGQIMPLVRTGYDARTNDQEQFKMFAAYVEKHEAVFDALLGEGERVCGEWLAMAHGIRYVDVRTPFVAFDLMKGQRRVPYATFYERLKGHTAVVYPAPLVAAWPGDDCEHDGYFPLRLPMPHQPTELLWFVRDGAFGAIGGVEGLVYRVERNGQFDFAGKFVRSDFEPGAYFPEMTGEEPLWNWVA